MSTLTILHCNFHVVLYRVDSNGQSSQMWKRGYSSRGHNSLTNTTPVIPEYDQDRYPGKSYTLMIIYITHRFRLY